MKTNFVLRLIDGTTTVSLNCKPNLYLHLLREDPPNRLAKMGGMPTPFRAPDRAAEEVPPVQAEREEPRAETPPGTQASPSEEINK